MATHAYASWRTGGAIGEYTLHMGIETAAMEFQPSHEGSITSRQAGGAGRLDQPICEVRVSFKSKLFLAMALSSGSAMAFAQTLKFGTSVAIVDRVALIGAPNELGGAAHFFSYNPETLQWSHYGPAIYGTSPGSFGSEVALSQTTAMVGDPSRNEIHVLERSPTNPGWQNVQTLTVPAGVVELGAVMALSDNLLVASCKAATGADAGAGRVAVFMRNYATGAWQLEQLIAETGIDADDGFGDALAADRSISQILVGAPAKGNGAVYRYTWSGGYVKRQIITRPVPTVQRFGAALATDGRHIVIGAPEVVSGGSGGAAFVYTSPDNISYTLKQSIYGLSADAGFGSSVAMTYGEGGGDRIVIGAPRATAGHAEQGKVHVYRAGLPWWEKEAVIDQGTNGRRGDAFGSDVAIDHLGKIVVGTPLDDVATIDQGTSTFFHLMDASWLPVDRVTNTTE